MFPTYMTHDITDKLLGYSKLSGKFMLGYASLRIALAYVNYLVVSKFGVVVVQSSLNIWDASGVMTIASGDPPCRTLAFARASFGNLIRSVVGRGANKQMRGIHTNGIITSMADVHSGGDGAKVKFIGKAGRSDHGAAWPFGADDTVPTRGSARPVPTVVCLPYVLPKSFKERLGVLASFLCHGVSSTLGCALIIVRNAMVVKYNSVFGVLGSISTVRVGG